MISIDKMSILYLYKKKKSVFIDVVHADFIFGAVRKTECEKMSARIILYSFKALYLYDIEVYFIKTSLYRGKIEFILRIRCVS